MRTPRKASTKAKLKLVEHFKKQIEQEKQDKEEERKHNTKQSTPLHQAINTLTPSNQHPYTKLSTPSHQAINTLAPSYQHPHTKLSTPSHQAINTLTPSYQHAHTKQSTHQAINTPSNPHTTDAHHFDKELLLSSVICNDKNTNMVFNLVDVDYLMQQFETEVGMKRFNDYKQLCRKYYACQLSKWEFDCSFRKNFGPRLVKLHNAIITSISWNTAFRFNNLAHAHS